LQNISDLGRREDLEFPVVGGEEEMLDPFAGATISPSYHAHPFMYVPQLATPS
jgi:hypothetical protein